MMDWWCDDALELTWQITSELTGYSWADNQANKLTWADSKPGKEQLSWQPTSPFAAGVDKLQLSWQTTAQLARCSWDDKFHLSWQGAAELICCNCADSWNDMLQLVWQVAAELTSTVPKAKVQMAQKMIGYKNYRCHICWGPASKYVSPERILWVLVFKANTIKYLAGLFAQHFWQNNWSMLHQFRCNWVHWSKNAHWLMSQLHYIFSWWCNMLQIQAHQLLLHGIMQENLVKYDDVQKINASTTGCSHLLRMVAADSDNIVMTTMSVDDECAAHLRSSISAFIWPCDCCALEPHCCFMGLCRKILWSTTMCRKSMQAQLGAHTCCVW